MTIRDLVREYQRLQRIRNPKKNDYCSYLLIGIMGPEWWIEHGFKREYRVPKSDIHPDFAHPELKIAIEGDGERWHMDVLKDERRDQYLRSLGWYVLRFRYDELKFRGPRVRDKILQMYRNFSMPTVEEIKVAQAQMKRSGFR